MCSWVCSFCTYLHEKKSELNFLTCACCGQSKLDSTLSAVSVVAAHSSSDNSKSDRSSERGSKGKRETSSSSSANRSLPPPHQQSALLSNEEKHTGVKLNSRKGRDFTHPPPPPPAPLDTLRQNFIKALPATASTAPAPRIDVSQASRLIKSSLKQNAPVFVPSSTCNSAGASEVHKPKK